MVANQVLFLEGGVLASKSLSFGRQQIQPINFPTVIERAQVIPAKTKPNIQPTQDIRSAKQDTCFERKLLASKCSSFYRQSGLETLVPSQTRPCYTCSNQTQHSSLTGN